MPKKTSQADDNPKMSSPGIVLPPITPGRRPDPYDPRRLTKLIHDYFTAADAHGACPKTVSGLAAYLGVRRDELKKMASNPRLSAIIKRAYANIEAASEAYLYRSAGQVAGVMFSLKNNFGWQDVKDINYSGQLSIYTDHQINLRLSSLAEELGIPIDQIEAEAARLPAPKRGGKR